MKIQMFACLVVTIFSISLPCSGDENVSWTSFRGPERTGVSSSSGLLTVWPDDGPKLLWKAEGAGRGYASVSIADGRFYTIGDGPSTAEDKDEYLLCFDISSGKQLWKLKLGKAWTSGPEDWQSSRSTPTIDGDRLYCLTPHGDLVCASTEGKEIWRKNLKSDFDGGKGDGWGYGESVLVDGDHLICTPGKTPNTMVALDKKNGEKIWSSERPDDRGAGHSSVVISNVGGTKVYVQTTASGALGVRAKDGELMWSYPIDKTTAVIPSPIIKDDLVFFTAGYGRGGALLRQLAKDGKVEVEEVYPLNQKLENKHGGVVLVGDNIYGDKGSGGTPFCADLATGEVHWRKRGSGKGSAAVTAADGHLYILFAKSATMVLAKADPSGYSEISSFRIEEGGDRPAWAHPVIAGGKLFLRKDDLVFCYDVSE